MQHYYYCYSFGFSHCFPCILTLSPDRTPPSHLSDGLCRIRDICKFSHFCEFFKMKWKFSLLRWFMENEWTIYVCTCFTLGRNHLYAYSIFPFSIHNILSYSTPSIHLFVFVILFFGCNVDIRCSVRLMFERGVVNEGGKVIVWLLGWFGWLDKWLDWIGDGERLGLGRDWNYSISQYAS